METCLIEGCGKPQKTRGLCRNCYGIAHKSIQGGQVPSWEFLVEHGMALPPSARANNGSLFKQKLAEVMRQKGTQSAQTVIKEHGGDN